MFLSASFARGARTSPPVCHDDSVARLCLLAAQAYPSLRALRRAAKSAALSVLAQTGMPVPRVRQNSLDANEFTWHVCPSDPAPPHRTLP
jgi:hypothetical protein